MGDRELVRDYLLKKYGYADTEKDPELEAARTAQSDLDNAAMIAKGGAQIAEGISGADLDPDQYTKQATTEGQRGVDTILTRRKAAADQLKYATDRADLDPEESENTAFREYLGSRFPTLKTLPGYDKLTMGRGGKMVSALESSYQKTKESNATKTAVADKNNATKKEKQARLSDKNVSSIDDFDSSVDNANALAEGLDDSWLGPTGPLAGTLVGKQVSDPKQVAYLAKIGRLTDSYRKLVTGQAAADQELKRIEGRLPQITDPPAVFRQKAKDYAGEVAMAKLRFLENRKRQGKDVSAFEQANAPATKAATEATPPAAGGLAPDKAKRLEELRKKKAAGTLGGG